VAKKSVALLPVVLVSSFACAQILVAGAGGSDADLKTSYVGGALTCQEQNKFVVPGPLLEHAKLKARLLNLLRESLNDDARGIVNVGREQEIKKLAGKLKNDRQNF
jgi:hypothetical protein